jgi:tetratricopeptide (TPR) repeat protein
MNDISLPGQIQGENLLPLFFKEKGLENNFAYAETYYPRFHYGWSELTSIQDEKFKLIVAPELELYDLINDPEEENNIVNMQAKEARRLKAVIDGFIEKWSRDAFQVDYRSIDEETREKLTALGYIGTFTDSSSLEGRKLGDPKEKIVIFNRLSKARELGLEGEFERAVEMMHGIIKEDPDVIDAYFSLGNLYYKNHKFEESLEWYFKALERKPNDAFTVINITNSYMMMGNIDEAERFVLSVINFIPPDSQINFILGNIYNAKKEYEEAIKYYKECLRLNPSSPSAYSALGGVCIVQGNLDEGEKHLEKAVELNPDLRNLHYNLAQLFEERGNYERAMEEYKIELANIPHSFKASFNLSRIFRIMRREEEEIKWLDGKKRK